MWLQVPRILSFGRHSVLYLAQSAHWYSQKMPVPYQHTPILGPRSIRILELQPAADPEVPISCKLRNISLSDFPQWHANHTALSYTWDGQSPSCEVDCDGANLLITPNCDAAIRQLRSATAIMILRIDSICIDQTPEAIEERNVQVALMGEIYKSAARVVVWLGPSNERVELALRQVMDIAMVTRSASQSLANRRLIQGRLHDFTRSLSESKSFEGIPEVMRTNMSRRTIGFRRSSQTTVRVLLVLSHVDCPGSDALSIPKDFRALRISGDPVACPHHYP